MGPAIRRPRRASSPATHASTDARQTGSSHVPIPVGIVSRSSPGAASAALAATEQRPEDAAEQVLARPRRHDPAAGPDRRVDRPCARAPVPALWPCARARRPSARGRPARAPGGRSRAAAGRASSRSGRSPSSGRRRRARAASAAAWAAAALAAAIRAVIDLVGALAIDRLAVLRRERARRDHRPKVTASSARHQRVRRQQPGRRERRRDATRRQHGHERLAGAERGDRLLDVVERRSSGTCGRSCGGRRRPRA